MMITTTMGLNVDGVQVVAQTNESSELIHRLASILLYDEFPESRKVVLTFTDCIKDSGDEEKINGRIEEAKRAREYTVREREGTDAV